MVDDYFEFFKRVWSILGPRIGGKDAPPEFWAHVKNQVLALWTLFEPL